MQRKGAYSLMDVLVFIGCLAVFGAIVLPTLARPRASKCRLHCANNLKQLGLGFKTWALDQQDKFPMQVPTAQGGTLEFVTNGQAWMHVAVLSNEINTPKVLFCPEENGKGKVAAHTFWGDGVAGAIRFTNNTALSYFVGVDANDDRPSTWLSGDANLQSSGKPIPCGLAPISTNASIRWKDPRHEKKRKGYLLFADGSVQSANDRELRKLLKETGSATNRLAMP